MGNIKKILSKNNTNTRKKIFVLLIGVILFSLLTFSTHVLPGTDDAVLNVAMKHYSVVEWVSRQYDVWSGRITSEALINIIYNLPLVVWQLINIAMYMLIAVAIYKYYTLLSSNRSQSKDLSVLIISSAAPFLVSMGALRWGAFWITGSLNYFWIATLALVAFYPILYVYINRKNPKLAWILIGALTSLIVGFGQEQGYLLLGFFTFITVAALTVQTKKIWNYPSIQLGITTIAAAISYFAPGNRHRLESEMSTYIPTFHTAPFMKRLEWDYRWFMDALINHLGFIMLAIWFLVIILLITKRNDKKTLSLNNVIMVVLTSAIVLYAKVVDGLNVFDFYAAWGAVSMPKASYAYLLYWTLVLAVTLVGLYRVSKLYIGKRFVLPTIFIGMLIGIGAMILSPTMYASGERTILVPSVAGMVLVVVLSGYAISRYWGYRLIIISAAVTAAMITILLLANELIDKIQKLSF